MIEEQNFVFQISKQFFFLSLGSTLAAHWLKEPRIQPGTAGWGARTLPLWQAVPIRVYLSVKLPIYSKDPLQCKIRYLDEYISKWSLDKVDHAAGKTGAGVSGLQAFLIASKSKVVLFLQKVKK